MSKIEQNLPLLGRILLGLIFVLSGILKIPGWQGVLGYMAANGVPLAPLFLFGTIVLEVGSGLALMVGFQARLAAAVLAAFTLITALIFHDFWTLTGFELQAQLSHFLKNLSIIGGLLFVIAFGPGPYSIGPKAPAPAGEQSPLG